jgi:uncharacterized repeat protein (TIGR01451 family)
MKQTQRCKSKGKRGDPKMNLKQNLMVFALVLAGVMTLLMPSQVRAAGTASGIDISNSAILDYKVGGVDQAQITSNTTTFKVDNKVILTVAELGSANVIPGTSDQVLVFSVTNTGNTTQGYSLAVTGGGTDDFDMDNVRIYLDVNDDGLLDALDTLYTPGTWAVDLIPDADIKVLVVADTPLTPTNGQTAAYNLIATTLDAGTSTITANDDTEADDPDAVQVVWADAAGTDDAEEDGKHSVDAIYTVTSAALAVTKTQTVVSDPINDTTNPKAIPGATVRYTITVANSGAQDATNVVLVDATPVNTTYFPGSITLDAAVKTDINDGDGADYGASTSDAVTVTIAAVTSGGGTATITFDVTID